MKQAQVDQLRDELANFLKRASGIESAMIVSADGLPITSTLSESRDDEESRNAAMIAAIQGVGEQASESLRRGTLRQVIAEGEHGYVYVMAAGDHAVLSATTGDKTKIGLMLWAMRETAQNVVKIMQGDEAAAAQKPQGKSATSITFDDDDAPPVAPPTNGPAPQTPYAPGTPTHAGQPDPRTQQGSQPQQGGDPRAHNMR